MVLLLHSGVYRMREEKKRKLQSYLNISTILFMLILIYLACNVVRLVSKNKLAVYEVSQSAISDTVRGTGIILRTEKVIKTTEEGYLNSYLSDGSRVKTGGVVYTIDKTGKIQNEINKIFQDSDTKIKVEDSKIIEDLRLFREGYRDQDFYVAAETKNEIGHDLLSYTGTLLSKHKDDLEKNYGKDCYIEVTSPESGLISYTSDGLEGLKKNKITEEIFNDKVRMQDLRTTEKVEEGTDAYRITTSQEWSLIVPLSEEDYNRMEYLQKNGAKEIDVTIQKDEFEVKVPFICYKKENQGYLQLDFDNYVQRYLNQRYLSIEVLLVQGSGLKIPASALVEKEVFRIPKEYLSQGSNTDKKNNVNVVYVDKKGREKIKQVTVKIFREEDDMVNIYSKELKKGDRIKMAEDASTYTLDKTMTDYGVYTVNSGYAVFSYVYITERNEDYCIVNEDKSDIQLYDRIILNSNTIKENEIIY